jgi:hypothetical protein
MGNDWDKVFDAAAALAQEMGILPAWERENRTMTRDEVRSYLAGFGLRGSALVMVTQTWMQDQRQAYNDGHCDRG